VLKGEHGSGATKSGLDFVKCQQRPVRRAQFARRSQVARRSETHATLDLYGFDEERGDVLHAQSARQRLDVPEGNGRTLRHQRLERPPHSRRGADRQCSKTEAVVGAIAEQDPRAPRRGTGGLDGSLDSVGAARGKQRHLQRRACDRGKRFGELRGMRRRPGVAEIHRALVKEGVQPCAQTRVVVADVDAAEARQQIEIASSSVVPDPGAFGAGKDAPVAERAEQLDEGGVDVSRVLRRGAGHALTAGRSAPLTRS
jgi:hypothetical protein